MKTRELPKIGKFLTSDGMNELRTLFAVSVLRSLSPRELKEVMNAMGLQELVA